MVGTIKPAQPKLSHEIARQISRDIVEHGYKEGEFLGQEPDLLKRYNISRDTFREAVRVLEWQSLVKTTRGSGGGLVVAKQSQDAIVSILRDYFDLTDITFKEVTEARRRLQQVAVRLATIRLTEDVIPRLEELLANAIKRDKNLSTEMLSHIQLIQEIAQVSNNRALSLFISPLDYVSLDFADIESLSKINLKKRREQSLTILKRMVSAIIDNDELEAVRQVDAYIRLLETFLKSRGVQNNQKPKIHPQWFDSGRSKYGQGLIYQIKQDIDDAGLEVGDRLGSEVELIKKYGVSRSIFREASRILELIGVSQNRKGRGGGLIVSKADPTNTIEAATLFLKQAKLPWNELYEARILIDTFAVELAAKRATTKQVEELEEGLKLESEAETIEAFLSASAKLHSAVCHAGGNRVIALYTDILTNHFIFQPLQKKQRKIIFDNKTQIVRNHKRIIRDIKNKDAKSASRQMRDHRAQIATYIGET